MFQFPRFPSRGLCVHPPTPRSACAARTGFPIRTSPDMAPAHGSPRLFAVFHVLLRRLTPRHPPYALCSFLHVMRRNCISTLAARCSSHQARYAIGKVLVTSALLTRDPGRFALPFRRGRLSGHRRAMPPNDFSRIAREPSPRAWPPSILDRIAQSSPAKQPGISPGCLKVSRCDLSWSGYSVPEAVRDNKFSFILQLAIDSAYISDYATRRALATEE